MSLRVKILALSLAQIILCCSFAFSAPFSLTKAANSQVLVSVTIGGKTEVITKSDLDKKIEEYKSLGMDGSSDDTLEILVNDKVFLMSAERDKVSVSDSEIDERLRQAKSQLETQSGRTISDDEFNDYIKRSTQSETVEQYRDELKNVLLVDKYVRSKKGSLLDQVVLVSDEEINTFFRRNRTQFVNPEYVRVSHIFAKKTENSADNNKKSEKMKSILSDIKNGVVTFERAVQLYTEDKDSMSRGGDIGSVTANATNVLGDHFVDVVFTLESGDISQEVIESTQGFHIVKATAHVDQKFLALDDFVSPDSNITVREYIRNYLQQQRAQEEYANVVNSFVDELKQSARIIYTQQK